MKNKYNVKLVEVTADELTTSKVVLDENVLAECKALNIVRWGDGKTKLSSLPNWIVGGGGQGGDIPTGTYRQVVGYDEQGNVIARTLGWAQFSDLPDPPPFENGVLVGSAFDENGEAQFGFVEIAIDPDFITAAKPNSIPLYTPGQVGFGGGTLKVQDAINDNDAVNKGQLMDLINGVDTRMASSVKTSGDQVIAGEKNFLGDLLKDGVSVATLNDISTVFRLIDKVGNVSDLADIEDPKTGDTYLVEDSNILYAWINTQWVSLGSIVDLSSYYDKSSVNSLLGNKQDKLAGLGNSSLMVTDSGGRVITYPDITIGELFFLKNAASNIQDQINLKLSSTDNGFQVTFVPTLNSMPSAFNIGCSWVSCTNTINDTLYGNLITVLNGLLSGSIPTNSTAFKIHLFTYKRSNTICSQDVEFVFLHQSVGNAVGSSENQVMFRLHREFNSSSNTWSPLKGGAALMTGFGSPMDVAYAYKGAMYFDTLSGGIYRKTTGTDMYTGGGWVSSYANYPIITSTEMKENTSQNGRGVTAMTLNRDIKFKINNFSYIEIDSSRNFLPEHFEVTNTVAFTGTNLTVSLQTNANMAVNVGCEKKMLNRGSTALTITALSSVTLNYPTGMTKVKPRGEFSLWKTGTNEWFITGDLE